MKCVGCGNEFDTRDRRQKRCKPQCGRKRVRSSQDAHRARTAARLEHNLTFIGLDGEGVTHDDGGHDYVLLSVGDRSLHRNGERLDPDEIFTFLWDCFQKNQSAVFVGFFLGYDFTHWLRGLPEERARMLLSKDGKKARERRESGRNKVPFPVRWGGWEFDILGTKRFKLRPLNGSSWMYVNDAGPFFQSSFLTAIDPKKWPEPICTPEEWATIEEGKSERSTASFDDKMVTYNVTENRVLARLMGKLNAGFVAAGVYLPRQKWFGPGQAAQAWMNLIDAPTSDQIQQTTPIAALEFAQKTYYGGWFEIFAHGLIPGESYEYDINSAYPHIISGLPCLLHGQWETGQAAATRDFETDIPYLMVEASVSGPTHSRRNLPPVGAMLHRLPNGVICRPRKTRGWFWWHELQAGHRAGVVSRITIHSWMRYHPCPCEPPYRTIADLYQHRLTVGKNTPEGKAFKLLYNSPYGKMAQSIGSPIYACSIYASLITAGCRTMILDAIATHPEKTDALLMVATDGVYFRTPHPVLDVHPTRLGAWDLTVKQNLSLFMPGVYWDDKSREKILRGEAPELKSRGISARDLAASIQDIDAAWQKWGIGQPLPVMKIPVRFNMVSATQALARGKWETCGNVTTDGDRTISADPSNKRFGTLFDPMAGYNRSLPYDTPWMGDLATTPYEARFGVDDIEFAEDFTWETPDGSVNGLIAEILK